MKIRFLGAHNAETLSARLPGVLVDGKIMLDAASLTSSLTTEEQFGLKAVLLTHQHYDHLRDMPMLGMNLLLNERSLAIYGTAAVRDVLSAYLLNGALYPRFLEMPTMDYYLVEPLVPFCVEGYDALAVPVNHAVPTVGYEISYGARRLFYSSDTGAGLGEVWQKIHPDLLVIEVTASNRWTEYMRRAGHLTPELLRGELELFKEIKGYLPRVYAVHRNPFLETEIVSELEKLGRDMGCDITPASEGMEVEV